MSVLLMLRSAVKDNLRPQRQGHFGAQSHTPRDSCVRFAADVAAGLAQHSPPGGLLSLTWAGLSPADRASFLALPLPALQIPPERNMLYAFSVPVGLCLAVNVRCLTTQRERPAAAKNNARMAGGHVVGSPRKYETRCV